MPATAISLAWHAGAPIRIGLSPDVPNGPYGHRWKKQGPFRAVH